MRSLEISILYIESDVPEGQTLQDWRRSHAAGHRRPRGRRALRQLRHMLDGDSAARRRINSV